MPENGLDCLVRDTETIEVGSQTAPEGMPSAPVQPGLVKLRSNATYKPNNEEGHKRLIAKLQSL